MTEVRAPLIFSLLAAKQIDPKSVGFKNGYMIERSNLELVAEKLKIAVEQLPESTTGLINSKFSSKFRGALASFLFEGNGAFRNDSTEKYLHTLGLASSNSGYALPARIMDSVHMERVLRQIIERAGDLLAELEHKFIRSEYDTVFLDQEAPGNFRIQASSTKEVCIRGKTYSSLKKAAQELDLIYTYFLDEVRALGIPSFHISDSQWEKCIQKAARKKIYIGERVYPSLKAISDEFKVDYLLLRKRIEEKGTHIQMMTKDAWMGVIEQTRQDEMKSK